MAKITKRQGMIDEYYITCPICHRVMKGRSENQVKYNLKLHTEAKHPECDES